MNLTLSDIQTLSDAYAEDDIWKHCGKWKNCSEWAIYSFAKDTQFLEADDPSFPLHRDSLKSLYRQ